MTSQYTRLLLRDQIGKALQLPSEDTPPFKYLGLIKDFNGLYAVQYSNAIKLSCEKYADRVLTTHGWSKPPPPVPTKPSASLPVDAVTSLYAHQGPPENTAEHAALVAKYGFAYRTLLGELLHAYVTCRPDIGYATITLSKFSTCPHDHHFAMLKKVANTSELPKTGALFTVGPNQIHPFLLPTSSAPPWMLSYLSFPTSILRNQLRFSMPHTPMICATANPLLVMPSSCVAALSPTNVRHNPSPLPAPLKRNSLPLVSFSFSTFLRGGVPKGEGKSNVLGIPLFLFLFLAFLLEVPKGTLNLRKIEGKGKAS